MTIFKYYTQNACEYECLLKRARNTCGCTPYNFPFEADKEVKICDTFSSLCFDKLLNDRRNLSACQCSPDCEQVSYPFTVQSEPLDSKYLCGNRNTVSLYAMLKQTRIQNQFIHQFNKNYFNLTNLPENVRSLDTR
jgi:hypothetical protein